MTIAQRRLPNTLNLAATAIAAVDLTSLADAKEAIFYAENAGIWVFSRVRQLCASYGRNGVRHLLWRRQFALRFCRIRGFKFKKRSKLGVGQIYIRTAIQAKSYA